MNADEVLAEAIREFGQPSRDVGSGLSIPQWDLDCGVLAMGGKGPTLGLPDGKTIWLIRTCNFAGDNLLQDYEMTTLPDPANYGNMFWIGNVYLDKKQNYRFVDSESNLKARGDQSNNFFMKHPQGRVEIIWPEGIDADSKLEMLGNRQVAILKFTSNDNNSNLQLGVVSSEQTRSLSVIGPTFKMGCGWLHYWRK